MRKDSYTILFCIAVYSNGLLNYNFQYESFPIVDTLGYVLSGTKLERSLDANDLIVLRFSFLILLYFVEKF